MTIQDESKTLAEELEQLYTKNPNIFDELIRISESFINGSEWPHSYSELTEEILPQIIGDESIAFGLAAFLEGIAEFEKTADVASDAIKPYLLKMKYILGDEFSRVYTWIFGPMNIHKIIRTVSNKREFNTEILRIIRADNNYIDFTVSPYTYIWLIKTLLDYLKQNIEDDRLSLQHNGDFMEIRDMVEELAKNKEDDMY
jgi:hypothetical protein